MKIDGSAFGQRLASATAGDGKAGRADNSYDAQIKRLQKERQEYVEKLQKVWTETSDPEQAEQLANIYKMAITGIDARIAQLERAKLEEARRQAEEQEIKTEPSREADESGKAGETAKAKETGKPESVQKTGESSGGADPFDLQEDEELLWIDGGDRSYPGKKRKPKHPSVLVDISV